MNIQITGRHVEITDALKQFAEDQVDSLTKYNIKIIKTHIILEVQNTIQHRCEINIEGNHLHLSAHAESKNMYESITKTVEKLDHQLKSHKISYSDKNHRVSTREFENKILEKEIDAEPLEEEVTAV